METPAVGLLTPNTLRGTKMAFQPLKGTRKSTPVGVMRDPPPGFLIRDTFLLERYFIYVHVHVPTPAVGLLRPNTLRCTETAFQPLGGTTTTPVGV